MQPEEPHHDRGMYHGLTRTDEKSWPREKSAPAIHELERLTPGPGCSFRSGKTYLHANGLSCAFRQWRATESHCQFVHGYALQVEIAYESTGLNARNWVVDFGGMKEVKAWLEYTFDHKLLIAKDDPLISTFKELHQAKGCDLLVVDHVGVEAFAKLIYTFVRGWLDNQPGGQTIDLTSVVVREHDGNWAGYGPQTS